jgi:hypothetical protein
MPYDDYDTLRVRVDAGIARATIVPPPMTLLDLALIVELDHFGRAVEADRSVRVAAIGKATLSQLEVELRGCPL